MPPDDDRDVFIYVEYARTVRDEAFVYGVLREWMEEEVAVWMSSIPLSYFQ